MSNTFFIGDTHFGHKNIIKFSRTQFNSIEEHDQTLIDNWNKVVKKNDCVWVLGDLAFGVSNLRLNVPRLNGTKKLVLGNHDDPRINLYDDVGIKKLFGAAYFGKGILTHIPVHTNQLKRFLFNIHGHMHNNVVTRLYDDGIDVLVESDPRYVCVSAEQINLTPISWEELKVKHAL